MKRLSKIMINLIIILIDVTASGLALALSAAGFMG
jgi:hypothetical protein